MSHFFSALSNIGGWESLEYMYMRSAANYTYLDVALYGNRTCGLPREDAMHIFRSAEADYPWPGMIGGLTILAINAWCTDQVGNVACFFFYRSSSAFTSLVFHSDPVQTIGLPSVGESPHL